ncbi:MAG: hypothetical protein GY841_03880 [FCB group bacterium]|nr:hypothetical protein [FCB group bacterium]
MFEDTVLDTITNVFGGNTIYSGPYFASDDDSLAFLTMNSHSSQNQVLAVYWPPNNGDTVSLEQYPLCDGCPSEISPDGEVLYVTNTVIDLTNLLVKSTLDPVMIDGTFFVPGKRRFGYFDLLSPTVHYVDWDSTAFRTKHYNIKDLSDSLLGIHSICSDVNGDVCYVLCQRMSEQTVKLYSVDTDSFKIVDSLPTGDYSIVNNPQMTPNGQKILFTPYHGSFPERVLMEYDMLTQQSQIIVSDADIGHGLYNVEFEISPGGRYIYIYGRTTLNPGGVYELYKLDLASGSIVQLESTRLGGDGVIRSVSFRKM